MSNCASCDEQVKKHRNEKLEKAIKDAKEFAKGNTFTGIVAICERVNKTGYYYRPQAEVTSTAIVLKYIHFDNGITA